MVGKRKRHMVSSATSSTVPGRNDTPSTLKNASAQSPTPLSAEHFKVVLKKPVQRPTKTKPAKTPETQTNASSPGNSPTIPIDPNSDTNHEDERVFELAWYTGKGIEVQPKEHWDIMPRYKSFTVEGELFELGNIVEVKWHEKDMHGDDKEHGDARPWLARVLEIRASDTAHVYLRAAWFYWPDQLPNGPEDYHGSTELIESNHMDIIDAQSINCRAEVKEWRETDDESEIGGYLYRQTLDYYTSKLSTLRKHCICKRHSNPDKLIIHCPDCNLWMHDDCIVADAVRRHDKSGTLQLARSRMARAAALDPAPKTPTQLKRARKYKRTTIPTASGLEPSVDVVLAPYSDKETKLLIKNKEPNPDGDNKVYEEAVHCLRCKRNIF